MSKSKTLKTTELDSEFNYLFFSLIAVLLLLLTNQYLSIDELSSFGYSDSKSYFCILLESCNNPDKTYHHYQRWPIHISIQKLILLLKIDPMLLYRGFIVVLTVIVFLAIQSLKINTLKKLSIFFFIIFNPYTFRLYIAVPTMISDATVLIGFLLFVIGILNKSNTQILLGVFISIFFKQSGLILLPIIALFFHYSFLTKFNLVSSFTAILLISSVIAFSTNILYGPFDSSSFFDLSTGIFQWLTMEKINHPSGIGFLSRYILFLSTLSLIFLIKPKNNNLIKICVMAFFITHIQPILGGPLFTGGNIQRLVAVGIPFLIPILINSKASDFRLLMFMILMFISSFHHNFSIISTYKNSMVLFISLIFLLTIIALIRFNLDFLYNYKKN